MGSVKGGSLNRWPKLIRNTTPAFKLKRMRLIKLINLRAAQANSVTHICQRQSTARFRVWVCVCCFLPLGVCTRRRKGVCRESVIMYVDCRLGGRVDAHSVRPFGYLKAKRIDSEDDESTGEAKLWESYWAAADWTPVGRCMSPLFAAHTEGIRPPNRGTNAFQNSRVNGVWSSGDF